ncbi:MAG: sporulation protein YqfD [Ruminococcus sp.]|nr:sporulation protein YqfD [Ruminococcus sp.]
MRDQLRGCIEVKAQGRGLYRFINALHTGGVTCFEEFCSGGVLSLQIYRRDLHRVESLAEECGVELDCRERPTLSSRLRRYRHRSGLIVGGMIITAALAYLSQTILIIDIQGNTAVRDEVILAALEELDIRPGTRAGDIDYIWSEDQLRLKVDGIAWAGMHRSGSRLVVEVTEPVLPPERVRKRLPCNIVASRDAVIVYTVVRDGMLMHKVGDFVPRGTLLISGVTGDETGHSTFHHAMGDIIGQYQETVTFSGSLRPERSIMTGRSKSRRSLRLFGWRIPLYLGKDPYESSVSEESSRQLSFFGKALPIFVERRKLLETQVRAEELTEEELSAELMEKVYLYEKNFLSGDTKIISRDIQRTGDGEGMTLTVEYTLQGDICSQRDIFLA